MERTFDKINDRFSDIEEFKRETNQDLREQLFQIGQLANREDTNIKIDDNFNVLEKKIINFNQNTIDKLSAKIEKGNLEFLDKLTVPGLVGPTKSEYRY